MFETKLKVNVSEWGNNPGMAEHIRIVVGNMGLPVVLIDASEEVITEYKAKYGDLITG